LLATIASITAIRLALEIKPQELLPPAQFVRDRFAGLLEMTWRSNSALSMLTFYINRAGKNLAKTQRTRLERAKVELKRQFGVGKAGNN
jgi:uncharacterized protein DUF3175